jgi:hypothetical protein
MSEGRGASEPVDDDDNKESAMTIPLVLGGAFAGEQALRDIAGFVKPRSVNRSKYRYF